MRVLSWSDRSHAIANGSLLLTTALGMPHAKTCQTAAGTLSAKPSHSLSLPLDERLTHTSNRRRPSCAMELTLSQECSRRTSLQDDRVVQRVYGTIGQTPCSLDRGQHGAVRGAHVCVTAEYRSSTVACRSREDIDCFVNRNSFQAA